MKKKLITILACLALQACSSAPLDLFPDDGSGNSTSASPTAGIYIAEYQSDTVLKYTTTGELDDFIYQAGVAENLTGLAQYDEENLLVLIDSGAERVEMVNVLTKEHSIYAQHVQFVGATRKLFFDPTTGIMLAPEGNYIEKFVNGERINNVATAFINAGLLAPQKAIALSNGNILALHTGNNGPLELRLHNSSGVYQSSIEMPPADANGDPYDIIEAGNYFYVTYYLTAISRIARFNLDGSNGTVIFQDNPGVKDCTNPAAIALRANGNFLVFCAGEPGIIEIDTSGNIIQPLITTNLMVSQMVEME